MYRRALLIIMAVVLPASALVGAFPQSASAADTPTPYLAPAALDAAKKSTERNSLGMCLGYRNGAAIKNSDYGYDINPQDIASGSWFSDYTQIRQWSDYNDGDDGTNCDKFNAGSALQDLGFDGNIQAACALGIVRKNGSNCVNGDGNMRYEGSGKQDVLNRIDKTYKGTQFGKDYSAEQYYVMAMSIITSDKTCKASPIALVSTATADQKAQKDATITIVGSDGVATQVLYKFNGDKGKSWSFRNKSGGSTDYITEKCGELADVVNQNANAYAKWVGANQPGSAGNPGTCEQYAALQVGAPVTAQSASQKTQYNKLLTACNDGLANKTTANYCKRYTAADENAACLYGAGTALASTPTGTTTDTPTADDKPTCGIQGIGWLVCPAMTFMAKIADVAYDFIASYFLTIDPKIISNAQTKAAWDQFRNVANVAFVIALLFIIYSQITSFGISNYGIKRMLPRILVAALLVNLSYYICSAAVDLSNLLGYAIPQFFKAIPIGAGLPDGGGAAKAAGWVALIGTLIIGAIGIALAVSFPVLIAALLAIALIVLMLIARQALVVLLIVISPVAFVAYLLPNTEQWFKKWYKTFFTLLMLFPIIGAVFGASALASQIIAAAGAAGGGQITQVIALGVSAIPFFVVPGLLKGSLSAAGAVGAKLQGAANKATGKVGSHAKNSSYLGAYMGQRSKIRATNRAQKYGKGKVLGRISNSRLSGKAGSHLAATGMALASKEEAEAVDHEMVALQKQDGWTEANRLGKARDEFVEAMQAGDTTRARAAQRILLGSGNAGISQLQAGYSKLGTDMSDSSYGTMMESATGQKVLSDLSSSGIKGKNAALDKMAHTEPLSRDAQGNVTGKNSVDSIAKSQSTYTALTDSELAGQNAANLTEAVNSGGLSTERAQRIKGNDTVWSQLSEDKKQIISNAAGSAPTTSPAPAPAGSPQPATSPAQPQNPTTLTIPHGGSNPPATPSATPPPGMTQRASGLFVPSNMNNGGNNTPPPPPPSNP